MNRNLLGKDMNTIERSRLRSPSKRRVGCSNPGHNKLKSLKKVVAAPLRNVLITISTDVPCHSSCSCSTLKKSLYLNVKWQSIGQADHHL